MVAEFLDDLLVSGIGRIAIFAGGVEIAGIKEDGLHLGAKKRERAEEKEESHMAERQERFHRRIRNFERRT